MPLLYFIPALSWLTANLAFEAAWVSVRDDPSPLSRMIVSSKPRMDASFSAVAGLVAPSMSAPVSAPVKLIQRRLPPTPTVAETLPSTPAINVAVPGSGPGTLSFCLLGAILFLFTILMFVGRVDKTQGRDPAARYRALAHTLYLVLCTVLSAPVVCLDLCLDALVTLVVSAARLWAWFRRILRLALGLLLSLLLSVLVFDMVRFLVTCNIIGGIVIDLAESLSPIVWVFVTHIV